MNTPDEHAPLLQQATTRRHDYAAPSSVRNGVAATLVAGCVVAVLAVSGQLVEPAPARVVTQTRAVSRPEAAMGEAPEKSDLGNFFTDAWDNTIGEIIPGASFEDHSASSAPGREQPHDAANEAPAPGDSDLYPGTQGCEATCESDNIENEQGCASIGPFCEWGEGKCWSAVGPDPCPTDWDGMAPAPAPEMTDAEAPAPMEGEVDATDAAEAPAQMEDTIDAPAPEEQGQQEAISEDAEAPAPMEQGSDNADAPALAPTSARDAADSDAFAEAAGPSADLGMLKGTHRSALDEKGNAVDEDERHEEPVLFEDEVFRGDIATGVSDEVIAEIIRAKIAEKHYEGDAADVALKRFDFKLGFQVRVEGSKCPTVSEETFASGVKEFIAKARADDAGVRFGDDLGGASEKLAGDGNGERSARDHLEKVLESVEVGVCEDIEAEGPDGTDGSKSRSSAHSFQVSMVIPRLGPETNPSEVARRVGALFDTAHVKRQLEAAQVSKARRDATEVSVADVVIRGSIAVVEKTRNTP